MSAVRQSSSGLCLPARMVPASPSSCGGVCQLARPYPPLPYGKERGRPRTAGENVLSSPSLSVGQGKRRREKSLAAERPVRRGRALQYCCEIYRHQSQHNSSICLPAPTCYAGLLLPNNPCGCLRGLYGRSAFSRCPYGMRPFPLLTMGRGCGAVPATLRKGLAALLFSPYR